MASDKVDSIIPSESLGGDVTNLNELTSLIQGVLQQTQDRFQHMSDQIIRRIDDMTKRIDDLEKNISEVMAQNQIEQQQP
ncbi:heat shock factor binding protein 1 [Ancylostoma caninum]|uniref:Heat shock factor binding protein n=1 Tax=Ancylostoma caninum TaxID=29170 RepID=E5LCP2_ANCCA|nr:heat shock factor binding protein [Ancylostoma caninum]RCN29398.1 heat shock factor binding protein 1 [Ancylostoma caninum]